MISGAMLNLGMGCGKTKIAVDLIINFKFKRVLILCPKSVITVWPKEFEKHAGHSRWAVLPLNKGTIAQRLEQAEAFLHLQEVKDNQAIIVMNYEAVWRSPFDSWVLNFANFDLVICDESHRIKAAGSAISKYMARLADKVPYRLCLTGTPMPQGPMDLYGQYRFLDKGIFGTSFTKFRARYAQVVPLGDTGAYKIVGYQNEDELHEKFYSLAYRADRDVLDLPEAIHNTREVELEPKTLRVYKNLEHDFYAWIDEGKEVTVSNALAKILRLQQVTSGHIPTDDGDLVTVGYEKAEALADLFEDIPAEEPIVVFCRFRHDLDIIKQTAEKAGRSAGELSGRLNQLAEWQTGKFNVLATQIQAGGVGVDLTRACYCIYYSVGHSLGDYEQSLARTHRPGQQRTVFYYHIIASGTIDEKVYKSLQMKKDIVRAILDREV